jgi:hypothetical protein
VLAAASKVGRGKTPHRTRQPKGKWVDAPQRVEINVDNESGRIPTSVVYSVPLEPRSCREGKFTVAINMNHILCLAYTMHPGFLCR